MSIKMVTTKLNLNSSKSADVDKALKIFKELLTFSIFDYLTPKVQNISRMIFNLLKIKQFYMLPMEKILTLPVALDNFNL